MSSANGQPAPLIGGTCQTCGLAYAPGGPHLVATHCIGELRKAVAAAAKLQAVNRELHKIARFAWLLLDKMPDKQARVKYDDVVNMDPKNGIVAVREGDELVYTARTKA